MSDTLDIDAAKLEGIINTMTRAEAKRFVLNAGADSIEQAFNQEWITRNGLDWSYAFYVLLHQRDDPTYDAALADEVPLVDVNKYLASRFLPTSETATKATKKK